MSFRLPSIALVGRPNVGKSRLFNRLARRRLAIVHDQPGVTRDVQATEVENHYTLLDTGGIGLVPEMSLKEIVAAAEEQVWFALEAADVIGFVVDVRDGLTPLDMQISERLRASGRPLVLIVNKVDTERLEDRISEFDTLGFERVVPVSAEHGRNESVLRGGLRGVSGPAAGGFAGCAFGTRQDRLCGQAQRGQVEPLQRPSQGRALGCERGAGDDTRLHRPQSRLPHERRPDPALSARGHGWSAQTGECGYIG